MIQLTPLQQQAVDLAMTARVMILTGGPGTGKTTTLRAVLRELRRAGRLVMQCAPTGRAAQRMTEQTHQPAHTIHRLLEYHPEKGFRRDHANPLHTDVLVVDEASMIDILLMQRLTDALPEGARLIIVGDADQLPSVGPGNVLRDLISSHAIPTVTLDTIQRQAEGSLIIHNAHRIIHGLPIDIRNTPDSDFFFQPVATDQEAADLCVSLAAHRLPRRFPGTEIQVLTPRRDNGTDRPDARLRTDAKSLNQRLQAECNPDGQRIVIQKREWRVGDRVMQQHNDYELNIFNGDIGYVVAGNERRQTLTVAFAHSIVKMQSNQLRHLQLAYAATIHKSQGSEFPIVIIPLSESQGPQMLQRNLLYTAVTRARQLCIIVGTPQALDRCIRTADSSIRNTRLRERMEEG